MGVDVQATFKGSLILYRENGAKKETSQVSDHAFIAPVKAFKIRHIYVYVYCRRLLHLS